MPDASISLSSGTTTEAQFRVLALPESALAVMIRENLYGEGGCRRQGKCVANLPITHLLYAQYGRVTLLMQ